MDWWFGNARDTIGSEIFEPNGAEVAEGQGKGIEGLGIEGGRLINQLGGQGKGVRAWERGWERP